MGKFDRRTAPWEGLLSDETSAGKSFDIFTDAPNVTTEISIGQHPLVIALCYALMQKPEGQAMLRMIVEKTLPAGTDLLKECDLSKVTGDGSLVNFTFVARGKLLKNPNPLSSARIETPYIITKDEIDAVIKAEAKRAQDDRLHTAAGWITTNGTASTTMAGYKIPASILNNYAPFATVPVDDFEKVEAETVEPVRGTAEALLTQAWQTVTDGNYAIVRSSLGTFYLHEADVMGEPLERRLYLANDFEDLRRFVDERERAGYDAVIARGAAPYKTCALDAPVWRLLD